MGPRDTNLVKYSTKIEHNINNFNFSFDFLFSYLYFLFDCCRCLFSFDRSVVRIPLLNLNLQMHTLLHLNQIFHVQHK
jgi:hypothetical protein